MTGRQVFVSMYKMDKKDLRSCRPVCLTSVSGKIMEQVLMEIISWLMKDNKMFGKSQQRVSKAKS